jgi:hypothetical protein
MPESSTALRALGAAARTALIIASKAGRLMRSLLRDASSIDMPARSERLSLWPVMALSSAAKGAAFSANHAL